MLLRLLTVGAFLVTSSLGFAQDADALNGAIGHEVDILGASGDGGDPDLRLLLLNDNGRNDHRVLEGKLVRVTARFVVLETSKGTAYIPMENVCLLLKR